MRIDFECDCWIETATQSDIDYVAANYREDDRRENAVFSEDHDHIEMFEDCWVIYLKGMVVGYCGVAIVPGETKLSTRRMLCFMSCENANRVKVTFVKMSRIVMRLIVRTTPGWVTTFLSAPVEEYRGSIIWHERVLKMRRIGECFYNGHKIIKFAISRNEVMNGRSGDNFGGQ